MTRLVFGLAAVVMASAIAAAPAEAKGPGKSTSISKSISKSTSSSRSISHNTHFTFRHVHYRNWSHFCWYPQYGCYCSYCPTACDWFYFYEPMGCYLPISYVRQYPPTTNVNVNVNNNNNVLGGTPALPVGATALPAGVTPPLPGGPGGPAGLAPR